MSRERRLLLVVGVSMMLLCAVSTLHAAEESGNPSSEHAQELFKWINFAIVTAAIIWLGLEKAPRFFAGRSEAISAEIKKATALKAEAERRLQEAEIKLANLEKEMAELRAMAQRETAAEVERMRALTRTDEQKIAAAAEAEIEAAERAARLELKALAANLAVDGAESLLARQLTPAAQESLISGFVKSLEGRPH
ncbi:MAG TPA: ATP synthase F0 subunit B [Candidatus Dormibacteraeota bacterium]|nr:ATP synthase F0 subunit B [Candidatus Dormibacteraeota bacterium]